MPPPPTAPGSRAQSDRVRRSSRIRRRLPWRIALLAVSLALAIVPQSGAETSGAASVAEIKRLYIANDEHTDYFWSATGAEYRAAFQRMLDFYMDQADSTASNPFDTRGRFNCDGSLWAWEYEHNRPAKDFERLVSHLRDGTISLPLQTCVMLYGAMPLEAVLRNMYYAGRLERRIGLRFPLVAAMENQTLPGGVASLWSGAGAQYSWRGICGCATMIHPGTRPREIYRFAGPDGQSVCMKWNSWTGAGGLGGYAEASDVPVAVDYLDANPDFLVRWPWSVAAAFGHGGDRLETETTAFIDAATQLSSPSRRVIVSNETDFFQDFLAEHGAEIPSFSGSFGNEWDLYTASMGEVVADFKRHVEKLRTAEVLATVASLLQGDFMSGREAERDSAFLACGLFYDHDWTADGLVPRSVRAQFERDQLYDLTRYVDHLDEDARLAVAAAIARPAGAQRFMVFNPLSWTRTDFADLELAPLPPVHVVDVATGAEVPSETVTVDGAQRLRILAHDVPAVGYRVFEVVAGSGQSFPPSAAVSLPAIDGTYYRVTMGARGNITSLLDHKDANRELVAGGGAIHDIGFGSGAVVLEHSGPVSTTLRVAATGNPPHQTRVTLYHDIDRIDIEGLVTANFSDNLGYTSSFALPGAAMRHEEVGMIARVARAADGGDYADENARTDYLTFNHFVDLSLTDRGITLSNWDSPFFAAGNSTITTLDASPRVRAVIGMQVDGPALGIPDQGGDTRFLDRFALKTHGAYDAAAAMRLALEHQNPLVTAPITGDEAAPLPDDQWSLVSLPSPDVLLWSLKPAEEGIENGIIARVWNVADGPRSMALSTLWRPIASASRTSHIETDLAAMPVINGVLTDQLERQQLRTYRLAVTETVSAPPRPPVVIRVTCYPNPTAAGERASIAYTLPAAARARVAVYDVHGARVKTLTDRVEDAGPHVVLWDARDESGRGAHAGLYFVRVEAAGSEGRRKIVLLQ